MRPVICEVLRTCDHAVPITQVHAKVVGLLAKQPAEECSQRWATSSHLCQAPGQEVQLLGGVPGALRARFRTQELHGGVRAQSPYPQSGQGNQADEAV